jgi:predicted alpha/beta hydrolase family esterase
MKSAIIIHGCSSTPTEEIDTKAQPDKKHWIPWIREMLIARGIPAATPTMPKSWAPDYEQWKAEFEKQDINDETTLIGHSCGSAFLVRWLGDSKRKIDKLILVAPWKIGTSSEEKKKFYDYIIDETIKSRVNKIVMFTADNEEEDGKKSLKMFHDAIGGIIIELKGRGHYAGDDEVRTEEFPELLESILN